MFNFSGFYEQNSRRRQIANIANRTSESAEIGTVYEDPNNEAKNNQWRRILLLVVAITVYACLIINNYTSHLLRLIVVLMILYCSSYQLYKNMCTF